MSARKSLPPPNRWEPAPVGWWFIGKFHRKLAHVWPGSDGLWRGVTFDTNGNASEISHPFLTEDAALNTFAEQYNPTEKSA
jgi:hypothetical protein